MGVKLAHNQYGKAETRVVRVYRDSDPHELVIVAQSSDEQPDRRFGCRSHAAQVQGRPGANAFAFVFQHRFKRVDGVFVSGAVFRRD